jgi:hypothetical protein
MLGISINGEAIFCVHGIQTCCHVESADWVGYIVVSSGGVLSYLASKPVSPVVRLVVDVTTFRIDQASMRCKVMQSPEWITAMSFEAHQDMNLGPKDCESRHPMKTTWISGGCIS